MDLPKDVVESMTTILERLYGAEAATWSERIAAMVARFQPPRTVDRKSLWDEQDVVLITSDGCEVIRGELPTDVTDAFDR